MPDGPIRCAIYTRKSSEEGLEQSFNSLHAQREACEAYVLSQAGEGWSALATQYDDGGCSGGTLDRPGIASLLADVAMGKIDVVVVYKVDRLTRSLADFAEIVKAFDAAGVSFVSITQAFNTTTSMGRLTLNMLLSFAQFEREVTGERIRDKIAASKAKGMWMGGCLPLGYDLPDDPQVRALVVNEDEAEVVRTIFRSYLELRSVRALRLRLESEGIRSKVFQAASGRVHGGLPFGAGALYHLLKNRTYIGEVPHNGCWHPGRHRPIIDRELFDAVQAVIVHAVHERKKRVGSAVGAFLRGRLFDVDGHPMSPATAKGKTSVYRYYVSSPLQKGQPIRVDPEAIRRVPANPIEDLVLGRLQKLVGGERYLEALQRVDLLPGAVLVRLAPVVSVSSQSDLARLARNLHRADELSADDKGLVVRIPIRLKLRGGRTWLTTPDGRHAVDQPRIDPALSKALRRARQLVHEHHLRPRMGGSYEVRAFSALDCPYERKLARLAFLAPDIQRAILEGRQPAMMTLDRLLREAIPDAWADQRHALGFA
jgi:DNA invertase Pin-like site-specific DNA recombinase